MAEKNKKEINEINENILIQERVAHTIVNSNYAPSRMSDYDSSKSLDALIVYSNDILSTKLDTVSNNDNVIQKYTSIYFVYLKPQVGQITESKYFCSSDNLRYICGIQKMLKYTPSNVTTRHFPMVESLDIKLLNMYSWNDDKLKSELGVKDLDTSNIPKDDSTFLHSSCPVFFLYSEKSQNKVKDIIEVDVKEDKK